MLVTIVQCCDTTQLFQIQWVSGVSMTIATSSQLDWLAPAPDSINMDGNISPSSDSGLGSEDEQVSPLYENIRPCHQDPHQSLTKLSKQLSIDCHEVAKTTFAAQTRDHRPLQQKSPAFDNNNNNETSFYADSEANDGEHLSMLLTSQNPDRIDVRSLRRNKVDI